MAVGIENKKGQLSVEFLVILGIILTVALVAIGLTLFFGQSSWEVSQAEISAYWSTQATPLRIVDMEGYSGTTPQLALIVENIDSKPITIRGIVLGTAGDSCSAYSQIGGAGTSFGTCDSANNLDIELSPSERATIFLVTNEICSTSALGGTQSFRSDLTFYYDTPYFTGLSFTGTKPIAGKCNPI